MLSSDLNWLAGYLEGEGCFRIQLYHYKKRPNTTGAPTIIVQATDEDVISRAAVLMDCIYKENNRKTCAGKTVWSAAIYGEKALLLMKQLLPLMGIRRQKKIKEVIKIAENRPGIAKGEACSQTKLNWTIVKEIRQKAKNPYHGMQSELAKLYNVTQAAIHFIIKNKSWREEIKA